MVGGAFAVAQGGKFIQGFAANALGVLGGRLGTTFFGSPREHLANGARNPNYDDSSGAVVGRTMFAAVAGGTGSAITGGKFANGAAAAAIGHLFNYEGVGKRVGEAVAGAGKQLIKRSPVGAAAGLAADTLLGGNADDGPEEPWRRFYHGTDYDSALGFLNRRPLDAAEASRLQTYKGLSDPGFYLATHYETAECVAGVSNQGAGSVVLQVDMRETQFANLVFYGAQLRPIVRGAARLNFRGEEFYIPPKAIPEFNRGVASGRIVFSPGQEPTR